MTVGLIKHKVYSMTNSYLFTTVYLLKCTWICDESYNFIFTIILEWWIFYALIFFPDNERFKPARFSISFCCFHPILLSFIPFIEKGDTKHFFRNSTPRNFQRNEYFKTIKTFETDTKSTRLSVASYRWNDEVSLCFINKLLAFHGSANI